MFAHPAPATWPRRLLVVLRLCILAGLIVASLLLPRPDLVSATGQITFVAISVGERHSCAITNFATVQCWGSNTDGQLGDGTTIGSSTPVQTAGLGRASAVAAGHRHTCAVTEDGAAKCWGLNKDQLGDGQNCGRVCTTPVQVTGLTSGVAALAAGSGHTCALTEEGGVKCWGGNNLGQLGDGQNCGVVCSTPVDVFGLSSGVAAIAAGRNHACALTTGGQIRCWGWIHSKGASDGALGNGEFTGSLVPVNVCADAECTADLSGAVALAVGLTHGCALMTTGGVKCWGSNRGAQLGVEATEESCNLPNFTYSCSSTPVDVSGLPSGVAAIGAGALHTCAVTVEGDVKCWGVNDSFQLGAETTEMCFNLVNLQPVANTPCSFTPLEVAGVNYTVAVDGGRGHTCALGTAHNISCWSGNPKGELGMPVEVEGVGPKPVGGISVELRPEASGTSLQMEGTSTDRKVALLAASVLVATGAVVALGGVAWYARRRWG